MEVIRHLKAFNVLMVLASFCLCLASENVTTLDVSLYEVTQDSVEIDWRFVRNVNNWGIRSLKKCKLVYGPLDRPEQLEVLSNFMPKSNSFKVKGLILNVTYHFHMVCHTASGHRLESNILRFTTGEGVPSSPVHYISSDSYKASYDAVSRDSLYSEDENYARTVQSSSVILGAVCGIVGFLIINVTVVMAVRKYSQRQMRRRRILAIEDNEYNEFPYLQGYE